MSVLSPSFLEVLWPEQKKTNLDAHIKRGKCYISKVMKELLSEKSKTFLLKIVQTRFDSHLFVIAHVIWHDEK